MSKEARARQKWRYSVPAETPAICKAHACPNSSSRGPHVLPNSQGHDWLESDPVENTIAVLPNAGV